jgi:acyl-coenzyme A synthetase/AMP-(fatty) acid ligase
LLGPEDHRLAIASDDPAVRGRLSSVGLPMPGIDVEVRDESGNALPAGVVGRIFVQGDQVSGEYAGGGPLLDERGFFDTRDEGTIDEAGYLFVHGRADDTIIRGGENLAPAEIEAVLLSHADVVDAAVVGLPDDEWGHRIEAVVVLRGGARRRAEDLQQHVRDRLRASKTPSHVTFWPEIPRTETGKLVRRDVVARLVSDAPDR